jgi:hypothetical protein
VKFRRWVAAALIGLGGTLVAGIGSAVACGLSGAGDICFSSHNDADIRFGGYVSAYAYGGTVSLPGIVIPIPPPPGPVGPIGDGIRVTARVSVTQNGIDIGTTTVYSPGGNVSIPGVVIPIPPPPGPVGPIGDGVLQAVNDLIGGSAEPGPVAGSGIVGTALDVVGLLGVGDVPPLVAVDLPTTDTHSGLKL